jgi:hypothetical protein
MKKFFPWLILGLCLLFGFLTYFEWVYYGKYEPFLGFSKNDIIAQVQFPTGVMCFSFIGIIMSIIYIFIYSKSNKPRIILLLLLVVILTLNMVINFSTFDSYYDEVINFYNYFKK